MSAHKNGIRVLQSAEKAKTLRKSDEILGDFS